MMLQREEAVVKAMPPRLAKQPLESMNVSIKPTTLFCQASPSEFQSDGRGSQLPVDSFFIRPYIFSACSAPQISSSAVGFGTMRGRSSAAGTVLTGS